MSKNPGRKRKTPQEMTGCLLLINQLIEEKGYVRGIELAQRLKISRPTVTRTIQRMAELGLANYERYRGISLTQEGKEVAQEASGRYNKVLKFLQATGSPIEDPEMEARQLASVASDEVINALESASAKLN